MADKTVRLVFVDGPMIGLVKLEQESVILSGHAYRMYQTEPPKNFQMEEIRRTGSTMLQTRVVNYRPFKLPIDTPYETYAMCQLP